MHLDSLDFLKQLISAPSPSGFELPAQMMWKKHVSRFAEQVDYDLHGNSIAVINSRGKPKIMYAGHCDELGFIIKFIDEKGFIYLAPIGFQDASIVSGRLVKIINANGCVAGVTCKKPVQMIKRDERDGISDFSSLWIDIGVTSREEAVKLVSIGDAIVYANGYQQLNENLAVSRGFDDKVGAFVIAEVLRLLQNERFDASVFAVSTVQEEIGLRGARTSTFAIEPMLGIAIDVTTATDHPEMQPQRQGEIRIGAGPVILRGANANHKVVELLMKTASEESIPYQIEASAGATSTDANVMQLSRTGVATGLVSIPLRYMHTPTELVSLEDIEKTIKLLVGFTKRVTSEMDFRL